MASYLEDASDEILELRKMFLHNSDFTLDFRKNTNFKLLQLFFKILLTFPTCSLHEDNETIIHPKK